MSRLVPMMLIATLLVACASTSNLPPAPAKVENREYRYVIGPGDSLEVMVFRNPELSSKVAVRPDGRVTLPLIEDLQAAGKNPSALSREIEDLLRRYIREPQVTVVVSGIVGAATEQVRVVGQASKPTALPFKHNMTLLDAMIAVGGLTDFAAGNRAVLVRSNGSEQYSLRINDLLRKGDISANVELLPGDVIIIPQSSF